MPRPSGLRYVNRIAEHGGKFYVRCARKPHDRSPFTAVFRHRADADDELMEHDRNEHDPAESTSLASATRLRDLIARYLRHVEAMARRGSMTEKNARHYKYTATLLVIGFGEDRDVATIRRRDVSEAVTRMFQHTKSEGAAIYKALVTLRSMMTWDGIPLAWKIPTKEINAKKRKRKTFTLEEIQEWIAAMPKGSVQRAFVIAKMRTWLRDIELREWTVGNVNVKAQTVRYREHGKQVGGWKVAYLDKEVVSEIAPLLEGKKPEGYVFSLDPSGRRKLDEQGLRPRFRRASIDAFGKDEKKKPRKMIDGTSWLRSKAITSALDELEGNIGLVSQASEHRHITTTEKYYVDHGRDKLKMKKRVVNAAKKRLPLRAKSVTPPKPRARKSAPRATRKADS